VVLLCLCVGVDCGKAAAAIRTDSRPFHYNEALNLSLQKIKKAIPIKERLFCKEYRLKSENLNKL